MDWAFLVMIWRYEETMIETMIDIHTDFDPFLSQPWGVATHWGWCQQLTTLGPRQVVRFTPMMGPYEMWGYDTGSPTIHQKNPTGPWVNPICASSRWHLRWNQLRAGDGHKEDRKRFQMYIYICTCIQSIQCIHMIIETYLHLLYISYVQIIYICSHIIQPLSIG